MSSDSAVAILSPEDAFVARALARAAASVQPVPGDKCFLEKRLAEAVAVGLADGFFRPELVVRDKKLVGSELPGWNPQPGTIDVAVTTPAREPRVVFELKIDDVEWTLWDIYKMVAAAELPTVEAAYIVVAGRPTLWSGQRECVELFDLDYRQTNGEIDSEQWWSRFLFSHYRKSWQELLGGGSGRLTRVPSWIWVSAVGRWPLPNYGDYEMRVIRVWGGRQGGTLDFEDDWPVPHIPRRPRHDWEPPEILTDQLIERDLPAPDAGEDAYHRFALSFNGYQEMGSQRRCARIANAAIQDWRYNGALPESISEIRACVFFEQRRWHHFGYGFDAETMDYLRALVEKLRHELAHMP